MKKEALTQTKPKYVCASQVLYVGQSSVHLFCTVRSLCPSQRSLVLEGQYTQNIKYTIGLIHYEIPEIL